MVKYASFILLLIMVWVGRSQDSSLPIDLRQHNLTEYNSSFFNPAFSLDRNNPQSVSLWTRWQWQGVDSDPTTLFLNYTRKLNDNSAASVAFFQHNTGVFFNTGGVLNYARELELSPLIRLGFGVNVLGFQQELADDRFPIDPDLPIPGLRPTNDFILQVAPGVNLSIEKFSFSLASENLFDYNFTDNGSNTVASDKVYMGMVSYDVPVMASRDSTAFLRPSLYLRTIPELENQIGLNVLLSRTKYWAQFGYNNFYGIGLGGGGTLFQKFSLGALVEFGTNSFASSEDPSFELVASYFIGKPEERRKIQRKMDDEILKQEILITRDTTSDGTAKEEEAAERARQKQLEKEARALAKQERRDSIAEAKKQKEALQLAEKQEEERKMEAMEEARKAALAQAEQEKQRQADSLARVREEGVRIAQQKLKEQKRADSINAIRAAEAMAEAQRLEQQRKKDSLENLKRAESETKEEVVQQTVESDQEEDKPRAGEKYEEVVTEDGLEPGYYLITNVFGTKKYYEAFMKDLRSKGLQPKSFVRSKNGYNYVYLERYNTMSEAREARDSNFNGKYPDKTWIFRVRGE